MHPKFKCPAFGKKCAYCKNQNHFASCCFSKVHKNSNSKFKVETTSLHEDDDDDDLFIDSLEINQLELKKYKNTSIEKVNMNNHVIMFKLDSGAGCNIIPTKIYFNLGPVRELSNARVTLMAFGRKMVKVRGSVRLDCLIRDKYHKILFYIVDEADKPILGLQSYLEFNLIKYVNSVEKLIFKDKTEVVNSYIDVFNKLGQFPDKPCHLTLEENATPVVHCARRIPKKLLSEFKETLIKMEKTGVICKETEPTDWVNTIVITEKKR